MFGLEKEYFTLNPREDFREFFVRKDMMDSYVSDLEVTIRTGKMPKNVIFGMFGIGKTHFLYHIRYRLREKAICKYVECPPTHRRSTFTDTLYGAIIRSIGLRYIQELFTKAIEESYSEGVSIYDYLHVDYDIAHVIKIAFESENFIPLWQFLSGVKLRAAEARSIEAIRTKIEEDDAVNILKSIGLLIRKYENKPLLLLIDELENTEGLTGTGLGAFTEAIRGLTDESSTLGIIFAVTSRVMAELPPVLWSQTVQRRIGLTGYVEFKEYEQDEVLLFIYSVISYRRDRDFNLTTALTEARKNTKEVITKKSYPFTEDALKEIINVINDLFKSAKIDAVRPKEAMDIMDQSLRIAIIKNLPIVNKDIIFEVQDDLAKKLEVVGI